MSSNGKQHGGSAVANATKSSGHMIWQFEELLNCMICFETFRNPKMLTCGHTFCADCLVDYQRAYEQQRRAVPGHIPCPTCRELTALPSGTGVMGLRNDFKVQKIEDLFRTMNVRQQQRQKSQLPQQPSSLRDTDQCAPCQAQNKTSKGLFYCEICSMSYCDACLSKHNRNSLFNNHKVTRRQLDDSLSDILYCKKHSGEQGKYICQSCQLIVCTACIVIEHADHDVAEMTSVLHQQQQDVTNLRNMVQSKNDELKARIRQIEAIRQANVESAKCCETSIRDKCKQTVDMVRRAETALVEELHTVTKDRLAALDRELGRIKYNISRTQVTGDYANTKSGLQSIQMIAFHEELVQRMRTAVVDSDRTDDADLFKTVVSFKASTDNQVDLGNIEFTRIGENMLASITRPPLANGDRISDAGTPTPLPMVGRKPEVAVPNSRQQNIEPPGAVQHASTKISSTAVTTQKSSAKLLLHISAYGDRPGEMMDPLGVVCLLNGDLVVSEWGNKRLQVFDASGRSVRLISPGQIGPRGIALTLKGNMIATDVLQKRLQVFDPAGSSLSKWGIGKFFSPCGVSISPNGNCVISDTGDHSVSIYRGETVCINRFGSQGPRDDQFDNPLYVTTGIHNDIYVSDSNNHCVKVFDSKGRFTRKIGSEGVANGNLKYPRGVCVDQQGNLIVADRNNDRVCMFNANGAFERHLITKDDGLRAPYAIDITTTGQLVVTESGNGRGALKVFQL